MTTKIAEGLLTVRLRGGTTVELPNGKVEITFGNLGTAEKYHFIYGDSPELNHLNTADVIAVTAARHGSSQ